MKLVDKNGKEINVNPTIMEVEGVELVVVGVDEEGDGKGGNLYFVERSDEGYSYSFEELGIVYKS